MSDRRDEYPPGELRLDSGRVGLDRSKGSIDDLDHHFIAYPQTLTRLISCQTYMSVWHSDNRLHYLRLDWRCTHATI